ncbi:MAG: hypothetical protein J2P28_06950 [Actinobacteria bacterium]|nr:hypothetical protein [Actinomycetota bacterium]MBO0835242.1 hypothetical protein [Actinomycetota bacterium]
MGLNMIVGGWPWVADGDEEYAGHVRAQFAVIREALDRAGAGGWDEPALDERDVLEFPMFGYWGLHNVRRVAIHLAEYGTVPDPLEEVSRAADDPLVMQAYAQLQPARQFAHLLEHSDCEGYYVPVDFEQVIVDDRLEGLCLGSSVRLLAETRRIASALGLPEDLDPDSEAVDAACQAKTPAAEGWQRYAIESYGCLRLIRAAQHSIATGAAIAFC